MKRQPVNFKWKFYNQGEVPVIFIYDDIGESFFSDGITAKKFAEEVLALGKHPEINVRIASNGGLVSDAIPMHNTLTMNGAKIVVDIDGFALSSASYIAMAGDEIRMAENGVMMIHEPWSGLFGTAREMRAEADVLDIIQEQIDKSYINKTGMEPAKISELMAATTWMTPEEALDFGFIDSITEAMAVAAKFDGDRFGNVPDWAMERMQAASAKPDILNIESKPKGNIIVVDVDLSDPQAKADDSNTGIKQNDGFKERFKRQQQEMLATLARRGIE